jgi:hypothetical protein
LVQHYDALVPWYACSVYHDLDSGAYLVGGLGNEVAEPLRFNVRGRSVDFQPDALRRAGDR